jgi:GT2 family glycosyltransferase
MLWTQDPRVAGLIDRLPISGLIYDLTDDWAAFESDERRSANVMRQIETLGRRADLVLPCSRRLEAQARAWGSRVQYLPNAVDASSAVVTADAGTVTHPELANLGSPRLGFAGTLHEARLDVALLAKAAELRPDWTFVLLGPDLLTPDGRARLLTLPNMRHLGVCPHSEVLSYVSGFDVCLLPNLVTTFTQSLDPLKLYEYLAAGRPVLATPAGIPAELSEHIATFTTAHELVREAERALAEDTPQLAAARRASVSGATWEARAAAIERALEIEPPIVSGGHLSVVIVSYNTRTLLERCLVALEGQGFRCQTIVVDNASTDGSAEMVRERFPNVELLDLGENTGFAHANNVAFDRCRGRYVLLLNSDALVHPGALKELLAAAERHPRACAVGAQLLNPDGSLQRSAWPFPSPGRILLEAFGLHRPLRRWGLLEDLALWRHDEERDVDFLIGACLLLRAEAIQEAGGFDERFWVYGEEADLQRRLTVRGWSVVLAPEAVVTHIGGASSQDSATRLRQFYSGQRSFLRKHGPPYAWTIARFALLTGSLLRGRWTAARVALELH